MVTMIVEDVAVVLVIALFVWLVPMRRYGIPGLRGRGRAPVSPMATPASGRATPQPRPVPAAEKLGAVSYAGPRPGPDQGHKHSA